MTRKTFKGLTSIFDGPSSQPASSETLTKQKPKSTKPVKAGPETKAEATKNEMAGPAKKKPGQAPDNKEKVTFYLDRQKMRALRHLALDLNKSYSELVEDGIEDLLRKHHKL